MDFLVPEPKLLDRLRAKIRLKGFARSTENIYCYWVKRYILFHNKRHPKDMAAHEVETFLTYLAVRKMVSASAQNQALASLIFLYKHVLQQGLDEVICSVRAKKYNQIPTVLSVDEVRRLLAAMRGTQLLMAQLTYGSGMRLEEVHGLRVLDLDFESMRIHVRNGKGKRDRLTLLPAEITSILQTHLVKVKALHAKDLASGYGASVMPRAYAQRMSKASKEFRWQFVFPAPRLFHDQRTGISGRWHISDSVLQNEIRRASLAAKIQKRVHVHTLRHCFATHMLQSGSDIRVIQSLLGHRNVNTTMIYAHIVDNYRLSAVSPLDQMLSATPGPYNEA